MTRTSSPNVTCPLSARPPLWSKWYGPICTLPRPLPPPAKSGASGAECQRLAAQSSAGPAASGYFPLPCFNPLEGVGPLVVLPWPPVPSGTLLPQPSAPSRFSLVCSNSSVFLLYAGGGTFEFLIQGSPLQPECLGSPPSTPISEVGGLRNYPFATAEAVKRTFSLAKFIECLLLGVIRGSVETAENRVSLTLRGLAFKRGKTIIKKEKTRQFLAVIHAV